MSAQNETRNSELGSEQHSDAADSVEARIASLRAQRERDLLDHSSRTDTEKQHAGLTIAEERIQELRSARVTSRKELDPDLSSMSPPPPPPPPPSEKRETELFGASDGRILEELSYPVDLYQADHDEDAAVDFYPAPEAYPVDDGDGDSTFSATGSYPVTDVYPADEDEGGYSKGGVSSSDPHRQALESNQQEPNKRYYQADKDVLSLLPGHLRKRSRPEQGGRSSGALQRTPVSNKESGTKYDELEKLFEEVER
jgi:hypothetical protein